MYLLEYDLNKLYHKLWFKHIIIIAITFISSCLMILLSLK